MEQLLETYQRFIAACVETNRGSLFVLQRVRRKPPRATRNNRPCTS
jgi:hypothetical protein